MEVVQLGVARTFFLLAVLTSIFVTVGYAVGGPVGMVIAFIVAAVMNAFSFWNSDKVVLSMHGAKEIGADTNVSMLKTFRDDTLNLAEHAGLPPPKVYIIDSQQPNAFATGRNPQNAAVAATSGLLNTLTREEVAGVMAHELAHVENRDTLTMTLTATLAGAIAMIANFALFFTSRERGGILVGLAIMIFAPMAAGLVQFAISRSREYEADRRGAEICGRPDWLANALEKIERGARSSVNQYAEDNPAMAHLYISNPLSGLKRTQQLFSTHPTTASRVEALRRMAVDMGVADTARNPGRFDNEPANQGPWG